MFQLHQTNFSLRTAWLLWFIAAIFYAYEFALRLSLTVMVSDLMVAFSLTATSLATLSAMYFYAYAAMQIPVGYLLDRFGPRIMLSLAAVIVASGCLVFAQTNHFFVACLGRLLIGAGSAFAFVGVLKLSSAWFPAAQFPFIIGMTNMLGVLGAIQGEAPLAALLNVVGWRGAMYASVLLGFILAFVMFNFLHDRPHKYHGKPLPNEAPPLELTLAFKTVFYSKKTWIVAAYAGLMVVPIIAFIELWGVLFLQLKLALQPAQAAWLNSLTFIGIAIGGPVHGLLSSWFKSRKPLMGFSCICSALLLTLILYAPVTNLYLYAALMIFFGFFTSSMLLGFALNKEINALNLTGLVIGFTNMVVMSLGILFQHIVSFLLDYYWAGGALNDQGLPVYLLANFKSAFLLLPLAQLIGGVLLFKMQETACKQVG